MFCILVRVIRTCCFLLPFSLHVDLLAAVFVFAMAGGVSIGVSDVGFISTLPPYNIWVLGEKGAPKTWEVGKAYPLYEVIGMA